MTTRIVKVTSGYVIVVDRDDGTVKIAAKDGTGYLWGRTVDLALGAGTPRVFKTRRAAQEVADAGGY